MTECRVSPQGCSMPWGIGACAVYIVGYHCNPLADLIMSTVSLCSQILTVKMNLKLHRMPQWGTTTLLVAYHLASSSSHIWGRWEYESVYRKGKKTSGVEVREGERGEEAGERQKRGKRGRECGYMHLNKKGDTYLPKSKCNSCQSLSLKCRRVL